MPATLAELHPLEVEPLVVGIVNCHRNHCGNFDRSDQINQNSRGVSVPPRGAGQTEQKAVSLQCRKIRQPSLRRLKVSKLCLFAFSHICTVGMLQSRRPPGQNSIPNYVWWWSLTGSNRRHPACKAGALPAELRPHLW
jgi:hypothetical protein